MSASTKTRFTGIIALGLIAAALIPAAPAVAAPVGGIVDANPAADHGDAVVTATLRRDPGAADPFFVQAPSSGQQATDNGAAGVLVPNVRTAADVVKARRSTQFPPIGDRSLFGPLRAHHKEGMLVHMLRADRSFVVAIQLERAAPDLVSELL